MRFVVATLCALLAFAVGCLAWAEASESANTWNAASLEAAGQLRQAIAANPRQVSAWLALGLQAERDGDLAEAESALKEAARLDRQYLPAWTLTNFYFRRGNRDAFWPWAHRAAVMTYDDFRPLFRLCDVFEPDAEAIMNRLGGQPKMLRAYVTYLAGEGRRLDGAEQAARRLMAAHDAHDRPVFVNLITREIAANRMAPALSLWNALFMPLDPQRGPVLTNGDLREKPSGEGFDWSMPSCEGLVSEWQPGRMIFNLNGGQPDDCILLDQPVPLTARRQYRLRFETNGHTDAVRWEAMHQEIPPDGVFQPRGDGLVHLRLVCRRSPGSLAFEGRIKIRDVRIE